MRKVERLVFRDMLGTLRDAAAVDTVLVNDVLDQMFERIALEDDGNLTFRPREAWIPFLGGTSKSASLRIDGRFY